VALAGRWCARGSKGNQGRRCTSITLPRPRCVPKCWRRCCRTCASSGAIRPACTGRAGARTAPGFTAARSSRPPAHTASVFGKAPPPGPNPTASHTGPADGDPEPQPERRRPVRRGSRRGRGGVPRRGRAADRPGSVSHQRPVRPAERRTGPGPVAGATAQGVRGDFETAGPEGSGAGPPGHAVPAEASGRCSRGARPEAGRLPRQYAPVTLRGRGSGPS
jgi:hypothetical protein